MRTIKAIKYTMASAAILLLANTASAEGFQVEYKDIDTHYGTRTKLFITSLFDTATIYKVDVNRGNCQLAYPKTPKLVIKKKKYGAAAVDEMLEKNKPGYKEPQADSKSSGVTWHEYEPVDLQYGQTTGYVATTRCRILDIVISSSHGDYDFSTR